MRLMMAALCLASLVLAQPAGRVRKRAEAPPAVPAPGSALHKPTLEQWIRHFFLWGPQINIQIEEPKPAAELPGFYDVVFTASAGQASQQERVLVSADGKRIIRGTVYDIAQNPFATDQGKLRPANRPALGPDTAPVKIAVFSDFQCGYCREEAKLLRQQVMPAYKESVRVTFHDYPIEAIHPWAKAAAAAGRCVYRQNADAFWTFHDWLFEHQGEITPENLRAKVLEWAPGVPGLDAGALTSCIDEKATLAEVEQSMAEGRALGVTSTPTLFVNGRRIPGTLPWEQMKQVIDHEKEYADKQACCEVRLPAGK